MKTAPMTPELPPIAGLVQCASPSSRRRAPKALRHKQLIGPLLAEHGPQRHPPLEEFQDALL
jgi:hypothetical protein